MNSLLIGPVNSLVQNIAYALPARQVRIMAGAVVQASLDNSTWANVVNSDTGADITAVFVRCATGATTCVVKV